jgi:hypothetical protein
MEVFKDSTVQALKGCLKWGDGIILVALNIHPGASTIINPLCSRNSIATTSITSKRIKPTPPVMSEWANRFSQNKYYCFYVNF